MQRHHRMIRGLGQDTSLQKKPDSFPVSDRGITDPVEPTPQHTRFSQQRHHIQRLVRRERSIRRIGIDLVEGRLKSETKSHTDQTWIRLTIGPLQRHVKSLAVEGLQIFRIPVAVEVDVGCGLCQSQRQIPERLSHLAGTIPVRITRNPAEILDRLIRGELLDRDVFTTKIKLPGGSNQDPHPRPRRNQIPSSIITGLQIINSPNIIKDQQPRTRSTPSKPRHQPSSSLPSISIIGEVMGPGDLSHLGDDLGTAGGCNPPDELPVIIDAFFGIGGG